MLHNAKKLAIGATVITLMVVFAWVLASVLVGEKPAPAPATTTTTLANTSSTAPATTRLMRGALCEALVQAELIAGSGSSDPRERLEQVLTGLPDYAVALSAVAREALVETSLRQDAELLASIASTPYDVSGILGALNAALSDEDYAAVLDQVRGLALSSKSLSISTPVMSAYALSGCQSRLGLLP